MKTKIESPWIQQEFTAALEIEPTNREVSGRQSSLPRDEVSPFKADPTPMFSAGFAKEDLNTKKPKISTNKKAFQDWTWV